MGSDGRGDAGSAPLGREAVAPPPVRKLPANSTTGTASLELNRDPLGVAPDLLPQPTIVGNPRAGRAKR